MIRPPRAQHVLLIVCLTCLCLPVVNADQALTRLKRFFTDVTTLEAQFEQEVFDESGNRMQKLSGIVKLFRPGRFRWEYVTPSKQLILADGQHLWIYDVALEQASVQPMRKSLGSAPIMLLTDLRPLEEEFDIQQSPPHGNLDWVRLVPKLKDTEFNQVVIGFDGKQIRQMELYDQFGQKTIIYLNKLKTNIPLQPSQFQFNVPPGVDVIGTQ